mgnify:CR=1 FL=1
MKNALIAVNFIGFVHFLWDDIDLLHELGYEVSLIGDNTNQETHTLKMLKERNVTFYDLKLDSKSPLTKNNLSSYYTYKKLLREKKFDLVHCHTPIVGFLMRLAARKYRKKGIKVIYTTHGLAFTHLSSKKEYYIYHTIEALASYYCDAIITINHEDYKSAKRLHASHVYHINGVGVNIIKYANVNIDKAAYRNKLGIPNDKILILSIGELSKRKNHIIILEALNRLNNKNDYIFAICGRVMTGEGTADRLKDLAIQYGIDIRFLGFRSDVAQVAHCADIGAIPSIREGLGLSGIEQLSAGVPMVGSDVQGIREYIIDGKTGYLNNPWDAVGYAQSISKLSSAVLRKQMKPHCLEIVKKFDSSISVNQRKTIYKEILK